MTTPRDLHRNGRAALLAMALFALPVGLASAQATAKPAQPAAVKQDAAKPAAAKPQAAKPAPATPETLKSDEPKPLPDVLARVGDQPITKSEAFDALIALLAQQQRVTSYEMLSNLLDDMIGQRLVEAAAAKEHKAGPQWLQEQIDKRSPEPSSAEVEALYNQFKDKLGGQTLEQARPRIVSYLKNQKSQGAMQEIVEGLRAKTPVKMFVEPQRIEVAEGGRPAVGPTSAPVTMIEFSDYQCPYCGRAEDVVKQVRATYGDKVRFVFRDFPLSFHPNAQKAAEAAACAEEQGKFWEMHDVLFSNQQALAVPDLKKYAGDLKLDTKKFDECLESGRRADIVKKDADAGSAAGVNGTPGFFINGRPLAGALPLEKFTAVIDDELTRKGVPVPPKATPQAQAAPQPHAATPAAAAPAAAPAAGTAKPASQPKPAAADPQAKK